MWKNHLKIAWRNLTKYKFYSLINILGLSIGLTAFLFILLYVNQERSYDLYHPFADRTYRVDVEGQLGDQVLVTAQNTGAFGPTVKEEFPEVETYCRFRSQGTFLVKYENRHYREDNVIFADSTLFQVFGLKLIEGDPLRVLNKPNVAVITAEMAEKYFGAADPIGKTLLMDNKTGYTVTGVMEKTPANTHFHYDFYLSLASLEESRTSEWGSMNFNTYVVLRKDVDARAFEARMAPYLIRKYFGPEVEKYIRMSWDDFLAAGNRFTYHLFPITDIHLYSDKRDEQEANSDVKYVWIFSIIGILILLIACINFMNLSTARSAIRAREVGVRKVVGAQRGHLINQFLGESTLLSAMALVLAWGMVVLLLPYFNTLSGKQFGLGQIFRPGFVFLTVGLALLVGFLAGSYPAAFLSRFEPVKVLKGVFKLESSRSILRNGLVVFQFLITITLLCCTLVVYRQLNFIQEKKLGYNREHLIMLNDVYALGDNVLPFKERIRSMPEVVNATVSGFLPVPSYNNTSSYFLGESADADKAVLIHNWTVDRDYIPTMDMQVLYGRNFSAEFPSDSLGVIINEKLASYYQPDPAKLDEVIGQKLGDVGDEERIVLYTVIGIIKDFNFESLRQTIAPMGLFLGDSRGFLTMRFQGDDLPGFIQKVQNAWNEMAPGQPFSYNFMDERFDRMYNSEQQIGSIIATFAFLAIFIACIGLVGLSTFIAQQRTKEIGVRKVLGASVTGIVGLLSRDFLTLVGLALVIATPLAWYFMNKWLSSFAYRIDLGWWGFGSIALLAGAGALVIAFLTVGFQSVRAALANPVRSLRSE